MTTQKREAGKNYIGLSSEEPRAADVSLAAKHRMKDYVPGLVAVTFGRRSEAR